MSAFRVHGRFVSKIETSFFPSLNRVETWWGKCVENGTTVKPSHSVPLRSLHGFSQSHGSPDGRADVSREEGSSVPRSWHLPLGILALA